MGKHHCSRCGRIGHNIQTCGPRGSGLRERRRRVYRRRRLAGGGVAEAHYRFKMQQRANRGGGLDRHNPNSDWWQMDGYH